MVALKVLLRRIRRVCKLCTGSTAPEISSTKGEAFINVEYGKYS